jgi:hypothetical protein
MMCRNPLAPSHQLLVIALAIGCVAPKAAAESTVPGLNGVEAVASRVSEDYVRPRLADGTFQPEFYAFGKGGNWGGEVSDDSIDKLHFEDVARAIAPSLRSQHYLPAHDPKATQLLVMVYWGTTAVPAPYRDDVLYQNYQHAVQEAQILMSEIPPQVEEADDVLTAGLHQLEMANQLRDKLDFKNAGMLGYDMSGLIGTERGNYLKHTAMRTEGHDEVEEIEQHRYFVVLMAYDFPLLLKTKQHRLLWEVRFSIDEAHNQFDQALPAMASYASQFFGQPSQRLVRQRLLNADVKVGDPSLIEFLGEPKK